MAQIKDHGGDLDRAIALYGGAARDWIDLSTGINRMAYPVPPLSPRAWRDLPTRADMAALCQAAARYYGAHEAIVPLAGAQSAIQLLPQLRPRGLLRILGPTYNEYVNVFAHAGWAIEVCDNLGALEGADIAIVVNPNNPDGRLHAPKDLLALRGKVGLLVVDESFMDVTPEYSLSAEKHLGNLLILKSFGKFFGLAGLRLGFALGQEGLAAPLELAAGPWPVSGAAIEIACRAFADEAWIAQSRMTLNRLAKALDARLPWRLVGGTGLFRLYDVGDAAEVQARLARHRIWVRKFPWSARYLRFGTPSFADFTLWEAEGGLWGLHGYSGAEVRER